jgi:alpha-beta hydrolase superfamily lysophospholipase
MTQVQDLAARAAGPFQPDEHTMKLKDGAELFYRAWVPEGARDKALVLFHRGHEHSGRWQETVKALALDDVAVFAWDARGHGRSPGERGSARDLATVIRTWMPLSVLFRRGMASHSKTWWCWRIASAR